MQSITPLWYLEESNTFSAQESNRRNDIQLRLRRSTGLTNIGYRYPGATHHGRPMQVIPLGKTDLPMEIILEYLDSLRQIYTIEVCPVNDMIAELLASNTPSFSS